MAKPGTFKDVLKNVSPSDKQAIVEAHVKAALNGEYNSLDFILRNSGEGGLEPRKTRFIISTGKPCQKCGLTKGTKPRWVNG